MIDIPGIGPLRRKALGEAGIDSLEDLLYRFPVSFRDYSQIAIIASLRPGMRAAFLGEVTAPARRQFMKGLCVVTARVADGTGEIACRWFNQPYVAQRLAPGSKWLFFGVVSERKGFIQVANPAMDPPGSRAGLEPIYAQVKGIPGRIYQQAVRAALELYGASVKDPMPEAIRDRHGLIPLTRAVFDAHNPPDATALANARRRLAFQELLAYQLALMKQRAQPRPGIAIPCSRKALCPLLNAMPFALTGAQERVLGEILADLAKPEAMTRLVQGDVGSGKTALAFLALYAARLKGWQGALMAPTEVLARQHYLAAQKELAPLGMRVELLTGSLGVKERNAVRARLASGEADVAIGTHALITQQVEYARLGLVITDEQHRFGVRQRTKLKEKGEQPNVLVMSATPIPRTLALILYGDLDISVVDELPPGRTPVRTHVVPERKREDMYGFLRGQIDQGGQVYVVCPLVEESEAVDQISAQERYEEMSARFPDLCVGLVHGRMNAREKDDALDKFSTGEMHILVSTTVIEVGVNVPNANVMLIEGADNFGLAQLHQLRGRVGRGQRASYCFLMGEDEKLRVLASTNDGFAIAQKDLEMRGPGEMFGTKQHGMIDGRLAALAGDAMLLQETHEAAIELLSRRDQDARVIVAWACESVGKKIDAIALN